MGRAVERAETLAQRALEGHVPSAARVIRWLEDDDPRAAEALRMLHPHSGTAHRIGITGPPGAGKSTLVSALVACWRARGKRVAVLAVDPSSPFSGGALLGDRVRMQRHTTDRDVFIRSMATRGALGGLSRAAFDATVVLDAIGFDLVLIETVGVGQDELDVVRIAHSTLFVCNPGAGDEVQAFKAGLLEAVDLFALNKADLAGADAAERALQEMLHLDDPAGAWTRQLLRTVAERDEGIEPLADALEAHRAHLVESGELALREVRTARHVLLARLRTLALAAADEAVERDPELRALVDRVADRVTDPNLAALTLWQRLGKHPRTD